MEIRIKVTNQEFADLEARSKGAGFPSVNAFARELMFPQHDYAIKWSEVKTYISNLKPGDTFYVNDALPNTPALFGRWVYEQQKDLGIELDCKDRKGTNRWRKK